MSGSILRQCQPRIPLKLRDETDTSFRSDAARSRERILAGNGFHFPCDDFVEAAAGFRGPEPVNPVQLGRIQTFNELVGKLCPRFGRKVHVFALRNQDRLPILHAFDLTFKHAEFEWMIRSSATRERHQRCRRRGPAWRA